MKPDYKNWMPKGMIFAFGAAMLVCCVAVIPFRRRTMIRIKESDAA